MARDGRREDALQRRAVPEENGYVEGLNGKLRDELLNGEILHTVAEYEC